MVLTAAMFRSDVKTRGLAFVMRSLGKRWPEKGCLFILAVAGDVPQKGFLEKTAAEHLPGGVRFVGRLPRDRMNRFYSAGDVFAFPGFNESLGMVYLEAQSCGLPVVALREGGIPEVVADGRTGRLVSTAREDLFAEAIHELMSDQTPAPDHGPGGGKIRSIQPRSGRQL